MAATMISGVEYANKVAGIEVACVVVVGELEPGRSLRNTMFRLGSNLPVSEVSQVLELGLEAAALQSRPARGSA